MRDRMKDAALLLTLAAVQFGCAQLVVFRYTPRVIAHTMHMVGPTPEAIQALFD